MKSKIAIVTLTVITAFVMAISIAATGVSDEKDDEKEGVKLFKKYKCIECHTVAVAGIGEKVAPGKTESEEDNEEEGEAIESPDLSKVGDKYDAKWISGYLRKKNSIEGRKHKKRFKGKKEERQVLSLWLESLKSDSTETDSEKSN
jgi:cytochrome c2